jgi:hypothetical protein
VSRLGWLGFIFMGLAAVNPCIARRTDETYSNAEYGFTVRVPSKVSREKSFPPVPQHGIALQLGFGRRIWVDASYDASFLESPIAALRQIASDEGVRTRLSIRQLRLAGLQAAETSYSNADRVATRVVALRSRKRAVAIVYTLGLDTNRLHLHKDSAIFTRVVGSFVLRSLPN